MKIRGNNVLLKGYVKAQTKAGLVLSGVNEANIERSRYTYKLEVLGVGPEVTDISKGDTVVVLRDPIMKVANDVGKWIKSEEELEDSSEYYLLVTDEDIKMVL